MEWISVKDIVPPKDHPFIYKEGDQIGVADWKEDPHSRGEEPGWFYPVSCNCCSGYCSVAPDFWMPLPEQPKD